MLNILDKFRINVTLNLRKKYITHYVLHNTFIHYNNGQFSKIVLIYLDKISI